MIRKVILTSLLLAVASAGAVTVQQLGTKPAQFACGQICSRTVGCPNPTHCFCRIPPGQSKGTCLP